MDMYRLYSQLWSTNWLYKFIVYIIILPSHFFAVIASWPPPSTAILSHFAGRIAPKWFEFAHALGVGTEADSLLQTEHSTERKCFLCLKAWIDSGPEVGCSWKSLFHELCSFQLHAVAKDIHDELQKTAISNHSI